MEAADELVSEKMNVRLKGILSFMSVNDVFVSPPTGYGKSLIYGILPLAFDVFRGRKNISDTQQLFLSLAPDNLFLLVFIKP